MNYVFVIFMFILYQTLNGNEQIVNDKMLYVCIYLFYIYLVKATESRNKKELSCAFFFFFFFFYFIPE